MPKGLIEYKTKLIALAIQESQKEGLNTYYSHDKLSDKIRGKVEFTGDIQLDLNNAILLIKEIVGDLNRGQY